MDAFKKAGCFDSEFKVASLEDLQKDLISIEELPTAIDDYRIIQGKLPNGNTRQIKIKNGQIIGIIETADNVDKGTFAMSFDKKGKLSKLFSNGKDTGYGYGKWLHIESKDGVVKQFSLANSDGKWICHEYSYDKKNPIKLF